MSADDQSSHHSRRFSIHVARPLWVGLTVAVLIITSVGLHFGLPIYWQETAKNSLNRKGAFIESEYHGPAWLGHRPTKIDGRDEEWERNRWRKLFYDVTYFSTANRDGFGDSDLQLLRAFPRLKNLELIYSGVTDAGLAALSSLQNLESLDLTGTKIGDVGLTQLPLLPRLRSLHLDTTNVTDAGLIHLARCQSLKSLSLSSEGVTDTGLASVARMPALERLDLGFDATITDAGLEHLKRCKHLQRISFGTWQTTTAGIDELKRALPGLKVLESSNGSAEDWANVDDE